MNTRTTLLALAALTATSIAALAPTSASAWGMGGYGHHMGMGGYGHHMGGFGGYRFGGYRWGGFRHYGGFYGRGTGYFGVDVTSRRTGRVVEDCNNVNPRLGCAVHIDNTPYPATEHNCGCETPAPVVQKIYVPVRVPVRVEVPVPVRVEVPVPVRVPVRVYVPVKTAKPCDCEAPVVKRQTYVAPAPAPASAEPCDCEEPGVQRQTYAQPQEMEEPSQDESRKYAARDLQK